METVLFVMRLKLLVQSVCTTYCYCSPQIPLRRDLRRWVKGMYPYDVVADEQHSRLTKSKIIFAVLTEHSLCHLSRTGPISCCCDNLFSLFFFSFKCTLMEFRFTWKTIEAIKHLLKCARHKRQRFHFSENECFQSGFHSETSRSVPE